MWHAQYTVSQEQLQLSAQQPIRVQRLRVAGPSIPAHDHEFYELVLVRAGSAKHRTISGRRPVSAGDFLILAPGQVHAFEEVRGLEVDNVYYLPEWVLRDPWLLDEVPRLCMRFLGAYLFPDRLSPTPVHATLGASVNAQLVDELDFLETLPAGGVESTFLARGSLMKCFAWLDRELASHAGVDYAFLRQPLVSHVLQQIERSLADGQPCDVEAWARGAGCSSDHLRRVFRQQTGERPAAVFQRRRLLHAAHALIYSRESISQIAHRLGFADSAHFSRQFRRSHGIAPLAYRQRFAMPKSKG